jgi:hypothetical protein
MMQQGGGEDERRWENHIMDNLSGAGGRFSGGTFNAQTTHEWQTWRRSLKVFASRLFQGARGRNCPELTRSPIFSETQPQ